MVLVVFVLFLNDDVRKGIFVEENSTFVEVEFCSLVELGVDAAESVLETVKNVLDTLVVWSVLVISKLDMAVTFNCVLEDADVAGS